MLNFNVILGLVRLRMLSNGLIQAKKTLPIYTDSRLAWLPVVVVEINVATSVHNFQSTRQKYSVFVARDHHAGINFSLDRLSKHWHFHVKRDATVWKTSPPDTLCLAQPMQSAIHTINQ